MKKFFELFPLYAAVLLLWLIWGELIQISNLLKKRKKMKAKHFSKKARTPQFQKKLEVGFYISNKFEKISETKETFFQRGIYRDPKRGCFYSVYIGRKSRGLGEGRYNECSITWSLEQHPELKGRALFPGDLKTLEKEMNESLNPKAE